MPDEALEHDLRKLRLTLELARLRNAGLSNSILELKQLGDLMSAEIDRLTTEVSETNTAIDGVLALVAGLAARVRDTAGDAVKANALADELEAKQRVIANAVVENTVP